MSSIEGFSLAVHSDDPPESRTAARTAALAPLVHQHSALLYRVAYSILRSPAEAEDAVQDAFLRVLQSSTPLQQVRDPRVWLVRIVCNLALDRRRRIRPQQMDEGFAHELASATVPADQVLAEAAQMAAALRAIDRLPRREREALLLSAVEELATPEIAAILDLTPSATRALLFRARARLRERLQRAESRTVARGGPRR